MGRIAMKNDYTYNAELDVWIDAQGIHYIKNEFNPEKPLWLDISATRWSLSYTGLERYIDWSKLELSAGILLPIKKALQHKIKKASPDYLSMTRSALNNFKELCKPEWNSFSDISTTDMMVVWEGLNQRYRLYFRELYKTMVELRVGGAKRDLALEMSKWKAREETLLLKDVLQWHETRGALTSSEEKVLRDVLKTTKPGYESDKDHAVRIYGWLLLDTIKRSSQVLGIRRDGLKEVKNNGNSEWFVQIQPVKQQTGLPLRWWRISDELAKEIISFSERDRVAELQNNYDRLIVWDTLCLHNHGVISAPDAKSALMQYVYVRKAISPRTNKLLHVTPNRIRHTGATRLAFQGVSRDIIQEILEHDSPESAQFYIDAMGSELVAAIEKAGRMMGNIFYELNKSYFRGKVVKNIEDQPPVVIPEVNPTPIIVGSCSRNTMRDGICPKHPFISCYECDCFQAWDSPDPHSRALRYFEKEIERWEKYVGGNKSTGTNNPALNNAVQTYKRAAEAVKEVLANIQEGNQA
jgi:integrase